MSREPRVVALGGGHGLSVSLKALRRVTTNLTAVVTVADNGGSSGRLREEFDVLPPGDLRMALAALCGDDRSGQTWARVLQHRFNSQGPMDGHSVGNLLITALWELLDDQVSGLDWVAGLLGARGRVLPMALTPMDITAEVRGVDPAAPDLVSTVKGQVAVATTTGRVQSVSLVPADPTACPEAIHAIEEAEHVVLGPGSWYSSVMPHLLVPELRRALEQAQGQLIVTLNLEAQAGETEGLTPEDHLEALHAQAPDLPVDIVLADAKVVIDHGSLRAAAAKLGADLVVADVAADGRPGQHDPEKLAEAYALLMAEN